MQAAADLPNPNNTDAKLLRRALPYMAAQKSWLIAALASYPLNALFVVLPPYLMRQILDVAIPQHNVPLLGWLCVGYFGALAAEYMTGFASEYTMSVMGQRAMHKLRADMFAHVQRLSAPFFDTNPIGRTLTRLTSDVEALSEVFSSGAISVIADILTVIAVVGSMLLLDVKMTLYAFLVVPPLVALAVFFQGYSRTAFRNIRKHIARINTFLAEHIAGMSVVQTFGQEERTEREFGSLNADYRDANRQSILVDASLYSMVEAIGSTAVAVLIWTGAADLAKGTVTAGMLVAFMQYIRRFFVPIRDLSTKYTVLQAAFAASERVFSLLDEPITLQEDPSAKPIARLQSGIALKDVWFAYRNVDVRNDDDRNWVLRGIDLHVQRGERVALVGATGSGKSSILKLLNRFYDVQRGSISIDGHDLRTLRLSDVRRLFAVVLQDVHLFSGTLLQNLAFADRVSGDAVKRAMQAVQADALVAGLPQGYDTPVQELGSNFSAGERQLLALARALALDPEVLILDEATSNIDSETEARMQAALDVVLRDRTAIVVAHRLSTIQKVDRIVVIKHGRVAEQGNHDALMRAGGIYKTLVELQFAES